MSDINYHLNNLGLALVEADRLYNSPWPDWDVLGSDAESPQLAAAAKLVEAAWEFVRIILPDVPRGVFFALHGAIADTAAGRSARLFSRPRRRGAPSNRIQDECALALASAIVTLLVRAGWSVEHALRQVSSSAGVEAEVLDRFRKNLAGRAPETREFNAQILRPLVEKVMSDYEQHCRDNSLAADFQNPQIAKKCNEAAGLIACKILSQDKHFCPLPRPPRRERAGQPRDRAGAGGRRGAASSKKRRKSK